MAATANGASAPTTWNVSHWAPVVARRAGAACRGLGGDARDVAVEIREYCASSYRLNDETRAAWRRASAALALTVCGGLALSAASASGPGVGSFSTARGVIARGVAALYVCGFGIALRTNRALLGARGLAPAGLTLDRIAAARPSLYRRIEAAPSLLWAFRARNATDLGLDVLAGAGLALAAPVLLGGATGGWRYSLLGCYGCYLSLASAGAPFYSYGWESQLLETTALAALPTRPAWLGAWALRLLCLKIMLGAGLIKARARRGAASDGWHDLTAMTSFFETQPLPGPLSRRMHAAPRAAHLFATASNHVLELVAPALLLLALAAAPVGGGRGLAAAYGLGHLLFQGGLVAAGNLSFLNYLTALPALACFDDAALGGGAAAAGGLAARVLALPPALALAAVLLWLNRPAYENLVGPARRGRDGGGGGGGRQKMNAAFDRELDLRALASALGTGAAGDRLARFLGVDAVNLRALRLANAYGAFGVVSTRRDALVVEGSRGERDGWAWREFDFRGQPADLAVPPTQLAPWHWRLDWQLWIGACRGRATADDAWFLALLLRLCENDAAVAALLRSNPFAGEDPPTHVRATMCAYAFAPAGSGATWTRERGSPVVEPVTAADLRARLVPRGYPAD